MPFGLDPLRNAFMYSAGLLFLALAKAKHTLRGYTSPKPFDLSETDRCVAYDLSVVDHWLAHLKAYAGGDAAVRDKHVLELGVGSDLGVGVYLLAKGVASYNACDAFDLSLRAPESFYRALLGTISARDGSTDARALESQLQAARDGRPSRLKLVVRDDFDLAAAFAAQSIDLVFSQAAFEHFDDVSATIAGLSAVCRPGAIIVAEIDLKTHSRWIRDKDPNNIYRYSNRVYESFWFRGAPNRVRPYQYKTMFERHGWRDVSITPLNRVEGSARPAGMHEQFRDAANQLEYLSVMLCARKA
jgi:SAM-dependent methyltransferase